MEKFMPSRDRLCSDFPSFNEPDAISLRPVVESDLPALYQIQLDPDANRMAAVIPRSEEAFFAKWKEILQDPNLVSKAIILDDQLVGSISIFQIEGSNHIGYWIATEWWGKGIASRAVAMILDQVSLRPIHARVAKHNVASLRILEKHGFRITGWEHSPGNERFLACEEGILILDE
jgi:RimJ/RimL family protein N-acetyltransferase